MIDGGMYGGHDAGEMVADDGEAAEGFFNHTLEVFHFLGLFKSDWVSLRCGVNFPLQFQI